MHIYTHYTPPNIVFTIKFLFLVRLTHALKGVKLQYVDLAFILIVQLTHNVLVEATVKTINVCYNGLTVPIRKQ